MPNLRPDTREVYEMVTKQKPSDPGALERQHTRQVRTMRNRKIGAFAMTAAIVVAAVAVFLGTREGARCHAGQPASGNACRGRDELPRGLWRLRR